MKRFIALIFFLLWILFLGSYAKEYYKAYLGYPACPSSSGQQFNPNLCVKPNALIAGIWLYVITIVATVRYFIKRKNC